ncbi:molybdopterin-dependent oxidoreductase [Radiobacillus sp. PE A8.2]|uniref:molybdopterin-dependent oxidoreductase n=1 Tax=Radiobacillus sp. PE A8.2 TaxID=3380349 RepID=UPI00388D38DB
MNWKLFFKRKLRFRDKLVRIHHANAILFFLLSATGLLLYSTYFRSAFSGLRVSVKDAHIWIGFVSILPVLFYLPKILKHLRTLRRKQNHRLNVYAVLTILGLLIVSGLMLTFYRQLPPIVNSVALVVHDLATWVGLPYVIFHSITRSKWFENLSKKKNEASAIQRPIEIDDENPILRRRSFLKVATGVLIALISLPIIGSWLKSYFPEKNVGINPDGNNMNPIPKPSSTDIAGRTGQFRYYTVTEMPTFNSDNWSLTVDGLVENKLSYTWDQFVKLQRTSQLSNFHCITGWSVYDVTWEGIPLKALLEEANVNGKAKYVKFYSGDGVYTDSLTMSEAMMDDVIVATLIDGELIKQNNGGPVRLITPKLYAYKSVKWLTRIELIEEEHFGYWEQRGYEQNAWVKGLS